MFLFYTSISIVLLLISFKDEKHKVPLTAAAVAIMLLGMIVFTYEEGNKSKLTLLEFRDVNVI